MIWDHEGIIRKQRSYSTTYIFRFIIVNDEDMSYEGDMKVLQFKWSWVAQSIDDQLLPLSLHDMEAHASVVHDQVQMQNTQFVL